MKKSTLLEEIEEIKTDIELVDLGDIEEVIKTVTSEDDAESIVELITDNLNENQAFDVEIIFYHTAMDFLKENDTSLKDSLELAAEGGYNIENLDSELLASLLASDIARTEYYDDIQSQLTELIETYINELKEG